MVRVLMAGGGSGGSATPILAVATEIRKHEPSADMLLLGTHDGPERVLAAQQGIPFVGVSTGKLRRYWDTENLVDLGRIVKGLGQSLAHVRHFRPDVAFGAGGFASVPPLAAAGLTRVPVLIHQQDVIPGLANRLLVPFARRITVTLPDTVGHFPRARSVLRGNPVRPQVLQGQPEVAIRLLHLEPNLPIVVVTGGGTGALGLNRIVAASAPTLVGFCQVVHLTGRGRGVPSPGVGPRYQQHEFLVEEMPHLLAAATVVVTRAGMGTLSELAALGKPALVVPLPDSHQGANAQAFARAGAAEAVDQASLSPERLTALVGDLLDDEPRRRALSEAIARYLPSDAASRIAEDVLALANGRG